MERFIIGDCTDTKGWCVAHVFKEHDDAEVCFIADASSQAEAWRRAWELNEAHGDKEGFYIALCKIDLTKD